MRRVLTHCSEFEKNNWQASDKQHAFDQQQLYFAFDKKQLKLDFDKKQQH